jgi:hypothetical protein
MHRPPDGIIYPQGTGQRVVFTLIGVFFMATTMSLYNKALQNGSLTWEVFGQVPMAFLLRAPVAFVLQVFVVQKFAGKMTAKYQTHNRVEYYAIRAGFTVLIMCPAMSLYSNLIYVGVTWDVIPIWLTRMVLNWMFAFCVQLFIFGPATRAVFCAVTRQARLAPVSP